MGADIYLYKKNRKGVWKEVSEKKGGYFRDSYNASNLLGMLGLSWWALAEEYNSSIWKSSRKIVRQTWDGEEYDLVLFGNKIAKDLGRQVKENIDDFKIDIGCLTVEYLKENHFAVDEKNTVDDWKKFFENKLSAFQTFIRRASQPGMAMYWSV